MTQWIQISSGRGPVECCWVVAKVAQQILTDAKRKNISATTIKSVPGTSKNTFKSVLLSIEGNNCIEGKNGIESKNGVDQFTAQWKGTIKWIGQSRFRPGCKRNNWFVSVDIFKPVSKNIWKTDEIKFEYMRSSGPGGQHANKTESAVRIRHLPTGLSAVAREERSQHCNKKLAMSRLEYLIKKKDNDEQKQNEQQHWNQHNLVERGNAVRVFKDQAFKEKI